MKELAVRGKESSLMLFDEQSMKIAEVLAKSTIVPQHFKGNVGNCWIALQFAARSGADPFMIMQSMYIVHNRPALETKLMVALFNASGRFDPIDYVYNNERTECFARSRVRATNMIIKGATVSIEMAKAEGWYGKNGSKWKTMPELMLGYRAAAFLIRRHAPEVTFGMPTVDEVIDVRSNDGGYSYTEIDIQEPTPAKQEEQSEDKITKEQASRIKELEKAAGRDSKATLNQLTGFCGRDISRFSDLSYSDAIAYIKAVSDEVVENENPDWAE